MGDAAARGRGRPVPTRAIRRRPVPLSARRLRHGPNRPRVRARAGCGEAPHDSPLGLDRARDRSGRRARGGVAAVGTGGASAMVDWVLILMPLLLLPVVLLFRFIGCDLVFTLDDPSTPSGDLPSVEARWRLG